MSILVKISIGIVILFAIAWGFQVSMRSSRPEVEGQVDRYFKLLQESNLNAMLSLFDPDYFKENNLSQEDWLYQMEAILKLLGPIQDFRLESWADTTHRDIGPRSQGRFYKLNYVVTYANDITEETFNVYLPKGSGEMRVLSHSINPRKLDLRIEKRNSDLGYQESQDHTIEIFPDIFEEVEYEILGAPSISKSSEELIIDKTVNSPTEQPKKIESTNSSGAINGLKINYIIRNNEGKS